MTFGFIGTTDTSNQSFSIHGDVLFTTTMASNYDIPSWAGKPPAGLHLDVLKGDKLIQKLMIDEKKCYLFGRNSQLNDFCIDHQSCSRIHAAFVYHKHLNRPFLVDLGSTHGTFIGSIRLEPNKPTQLPIDSLFHFGASTRNYILRERPSQASRPIMEELEKNAEDAEGGLLGLPETETELDNLTEFNTAHNRRISMLGINDDEMRAPPRKRKRRGVTFNEDEEIINPEDVDPSVGRFRNLIHTTVVPSRKQRMEMPGGVTSGLIGDDRISVKHLPTSALMPSLYDNLPAESTTGAVSSISFSSAMASRLGISLPNPAPEVDYFSPPSETPAPAAPTTAEPEPKKKKYAKEAWPGKKPAPAMLL